MIKNIHKLTIFILVFLFFYIKIGYTIEFYSKRTITIFNLQNTEFFKNYKESLLNLGRFDYLDININTTDINEFINATIEYAKDYAKQKLFKQNLPDFKFKTVIFSKQEMDRILNSTYIFYPQWNFSSITISEPKIIKKEKEIIIDKQGNKTINLAKDITTVVVSTIFTLNTDIYDNNFNKVTTITSHTNLYKEITKEIEENLEQEEIQKREEEFEQKINEALNSKPEIYFFNEALSVQDSLNSDHIIQLRKTDIFTIKSKVIDFKNSNIKILYGKDIGIQLDDSYKAFITEEINNELINKEIAYLKVREVSENISTLQPIIVNEKISLDDIVIEYPKYNVNFNLCLGLYPSVSLDKNKLIFTPTLIAGIEQNLAPNIGLSEFYSVLEGTFNFNDNFNNILITLGLEKRYFINQLGLNIGLKGGMGLVNGNIYENSPINSSIINSSIDLSSSSIGIILNLGLNYYINPDLIFLIELGYQKFTPYSKWYAYTSYTDKDKNKVIQELDINKLKITHSDIDISGINTKLGFKFLF